ncbi:MAG TPA: hypothetical protein VGB56_09815 [Flavisolibacter sp.]|jgi:hypothetical protein
MERNREQQEEGGKHENPLPSEIGKEERQQTALAHDEAEKDIEEDPEFSASSPNDDLDEGETARLGDDGAGII